MKLPEKWQKIVKQNGVHCSIKFMVKMKNISFFFFIFLLKDNCFLSFLLKNQRNFLANYFLECHMYVYVYILYM